MDRRIMKYHLDSLTDGYNSLERGVRPRQSARELASIIISSVCRLLPVQERDSSYFCQSKDIIELAYMTLTLIEKINSKLMSEIMAPETSLYFFEIWRELFQEKDLMSKLVQLFQAEDQMISHLAAKSVSTSVICELQNCDAVNPVWQRKCVEAFQNPCPCDELDACMWSFTSVLKTILKGSHESKTDNLEKLLVAFNPALSDLFSKLLPEDKKGEHRSAVYFSSSADHGGTVAIFLDLLEVLNASRLICRTTNHLHCQRLVHTHTTALLRTVDSPVEYFVKKRVLLLLKRVLLQKAGEDMALGVLSSTQLKDQHLCADMTTLANGVLQTVASGWLQCLPVKEASSFFGGTSGGQQSDYVMLRAVSLVLVKSMEFRMQSDAAAGVDCAIEVNGYQQALLGFLQQHSVPVEERGHPCSWLTLVFGEQDDDMMEAAKALLLLFLYHSQSPGAYDAVAPEKACTSGSNPHCHFLLFLQSISFDHSILLDFLISTETCFLEYFVRYLKHLWADWEGFSLACQRTETLDPGRAECSRPAPRCSGAPAGAGPHLVQPEVGAPLVGGAPKVRLVAYGSSEESDTDSMEVSEASQDTGLGNSEVAVCDDRLGGSSLKRGMSGLTVDTYAHMQTECPSSDLTAQLQMGSVFRQKIPLSEIVKTVLCLSELRRLVTRLHAKNLFPYNPTSLLKLLAHVETVKTQH